MKCICLPSECLWWVLHPVLPPLEPHWQPWAHGLVSFEGTDVNRRFLSALLSATPQAHYRSVNVQRSSGRSVVSISLSQGQMCPQKIQLRIYPLLSTVILAQHQGSQHELELLLRTSITYTESSPGLTEHVTNHMQTGVKLFLLSLLSNSIMFPVPQSCLLLPIPHCQYLSFH